MDMIYIDTEYRDDAVILACLHLPGKGTLNVDLRKPEGVTKLRGVVEDYSDFVWACYSANADLTAMMRVGVDVSDLDFIDLMAEARMITLTHRHYRSHSASLVDSLEALGLGDLVPDEKDDTRDLILGSTEYTDEEWGRIVRYCRQDTECLPALWEKIQSIHEAEGSPLCVGENNTALFRGDYAKHAAIADHKTLGFPIDVPWMDAILDNKEAIISKLAEEINEEYNLPIFQWNKKENRHARNALNTDFLIQREAHKHSVKWERTEKNTHYKTDKEYLKQKIIQVPSLTLFAETKKTVDALRMKTDLRSLLEDGYIKAPTFPFRAVTGRNGPAPSKGFILGLPKWMRSLVKPLPGMAFVGADWSQQEIALAAVLSGDSNLLEVYNSGDCYLELAKRGGAIPPDGTKDQYPLERQMYKAVQLGIGYGKGLESLQDDVYHCAQDGKGNYHLTRSEAEQKAKDIWKWHHREFEVYWRWIDKDVIRGAKMDGWWSTLNEDWTYFVNRNTPKTKLLNLPMQAHGAVLMRIASILCVNSGMDLAASQHDSLYSNCKLEDADKTLEIMTDCMNQAVSNLFGDEVDIRIDTHVWTNDNPYRDEEATKTYNQMVALVKEATGKNFGEDT